MWQYPVYFFVGVSGFPPPRECQEKGLCCIVWYNGDQILGFNPDSYATNSCIQDCNEVNDNYNFEPGFAYTTVPDNIPVPNNYHLAWNSPCKELGNPSFSYVDEVDIDGEDRIYGDYVDIGADEVYSCDDDLSEDDIYNPVDWTADGIVNMHEYGIFSMAWLSVDPNNPLCDPNNPNYVSDPNEPGYISEGDKVRYSSRCDIDDDLDVDMGDLALFCDEWLWIACWKQSWMDSSIMMMAMGMGGGESAMMSVPMTATTSAESPVISEPELSEEEQLATLVMGIHAILAEIDKSIAEGHENSENLYDAADFLEEVLLDLKGDYSAKEDLK